MTTPTDPAFAGERIDLPNGWHFECETVWSRLVGPGAAGANFVTTETARAFAASFSASAPEVTKEDRDIVTALKLTANQLTSDFHSNAVFDALALIARLMRASAGVPDGYKLVPVEATREMVEAEPDDWRGPEQEPYKTALYRCMVAASPRFALPTAQGVPDELRVLYEDVTDVVRKYHPESEGKWFSTKCERSKGYLYGVGGFGLIASGTIGSYREFELIALVLNSLPALIARAAVSSSTAPGQEEGHE